MSAKPNLIFATLILCLLCMTSPAQAAPPRFQAPEGYELITAAPGVQLFRKSYSNGTPDYVQVIDLSQGAQIIPLHGGIAESRPEKGAYGGSDPRFYSKSLQKYWAELTERHPEAFCITNGQFFYMPEYPTRLPFPLRVDNQVVSDGYDLRGFPDQKLLLLLWQNKADIVPLARDVLYNTTAPHAIGGLTEDARKSPTHHVGRTFVGVDDHDGDGQAELVLVFSTRSARQKDAAAALRAFGADRVMMFDGGGSAQLACQGVDYVASERLLPQVLGVVAGQLDPAPVMDIPNDGPALAANPAALDNEPPAAQAEPPAVFDQMAVNEAQLVDQPKNQAALSASPGAVRLENVIWVPISILPLALILLLVIGRVRREAY